MATVPVVAVEGLNELRRDLIRLHNSDEVNAAFRAAGYAVAGPLASTVRASLPRRTGRLASTIRVARIRTGAALRVGYARNPYAGPVEFGGWPPGRPYLSSGRYIFPAARGAAGTAGVRYETELARHLDRFNWSHP